MYREGKSACECISLSLFLVVGFLGSAVGSSAQGWSSGAGKPADNSTSNPSRSAQRAGRVGKTGKSAKAARTNGSASRSTREKGTAGGAKTGAGIATNNGSGATDAPSGSTSPSGLTNKTVAKSSTRANPTKAVRCDPEKEERTDLSGTYSGKVNYPARGLDGEATMTISGTRFTLAAGAKTETGNITAVTTCNYTAVAVMFGQWKTPQPGDPVEPPLPVLSLRATRKGGHLTLIPSASERRIFSFEPAPKK